jgi:imidazolonepropionase
VAEITRGAVAAREGKLVFIGAERDLDDAVALLPEARIVDAGGGTVLPGFCDAHTHLPFAGTREDEFGMRAAGATYEEIHAAGGGILSTVKATRAASEEQLLTLALPRLRRMLQHGTTSIEAKSGYGLSEEGEIKQLRVLRQLADVQPVEITPTLLAAHTLPPEYKDHRAGYVELVVDRIIPRVAREELAVACDAFLEQGAFDAGESRRVLEAGRAHGLRPRLHADQLSSCGGAELAAELQALSADHLEGASAEGLRAMAEAGTVAVLLPGATFFLRKDRYADPATLRQAGVPFALATDFNPGSCYTESMPMILTLAMLKLSMSIEECIIAATVNGAAALGRGAEVGSLEVGKQADLILLDLPGYRHLGYHFGVNPVRAVVKQGRVVDF